MRNKVLIVLLALFSLLIVVLGSRNLPPNLLEWFLFSNSSYSKKIQVETYVITQKQACKIMCDLPPEIVQLDMNDLGGKRIYLFLKVWNTDKKTATGTLEYQIPSITDTLYLSIYKLRAFGKNHPSLYLIDLGKLEPLPQKRENPVVKCRWKELYTK